MKILAVDFGSKRIGLAVSDATGTLASPLPHVSGESPKKAATEIARLAKEDGCSEVLLGLPRNMDGSYGPAADGVRAFGALLEPLLGGIIIKYIDERLTTVQASRLLHEQGLDTRKQRKKIDSASAAVLLQGYLDVRAPLPFDADEIDQS